MNDVFGRIIGQYILLEQLGEGGMAKVYNALDSRMERNVAIKVILPSKRSSQVFLEQFEMEAKALANLTHTNIVKVLNYGIDNEQPFLVMEYISGGTLRDAMNQKLPWQTAAAVLAPVARALEYVHRQQIVHRDVKPSNILLQEDFRPMLSDFGILKLLETKEEKVSSAIGVGVGTPEYMSPEQGMGRDVDFRADIYSLGLVFYELVTGQKPFTADTPMAMVLRHVTDELPLPTSIDRKIPRFVEQAILRALQKKPEDRYASMGDFADALEMIALGKNAPQKRIIKITQNKKKGWSFIPVAILLVALAAIIGASIWGYNQFYGSTPQPTAVSSIVPLVKPDEPKPENTATSVPTAEQNSEPASTLTVNPTEIVPVNSSSIVTLLGTPLPAGQMGQFKEIARWGIGGVNVVAWSPNGETVALGTTSGIFIYGTQDKNQTLFIDTQFNVVAMTFNPDGTLLTAGSPDGVVTAWNSQTGAIVQNFTYQRPTSNRIIASTSTTERIVTAISYSQNGRNLAVSYQNGTIDYFSADQSSAIAAFDEYPTATDLAISGDGRFIYASNGGRTVSVWDIPAKTKISELAHTSSISKLSISGNRQYMLSGGSTNAVYLWDLSAPKLVTSFAALGGTATDFDFSYDDKYVVIGLNSGDIKVFEIPQPENYSKTQVPILSVKGYMEQVRTVAFSPNQLVAAAGNWEEGLKLWDILSSENTFSLDQSMRAINEIYFSDNGSWLATYHDGETVRVWRVSSAQEAYQFEGYLPKGNPFSSDNKFLAFIASSEKNRPEAIKVVELSSGNIIANLPGYPSKSIVQFTEDSKLLVAGTSDVAKIWDVSTWEQVSSHGGYTDGCGQFFTPDPQNNLLAVISNAGIFSSYEKELCGTKISGATLMYYFPNRKQLLFILGDGALWIGNSASRDISRKAFGSPYPLPGKVFIAGEESGWYAQVIGDKLYIKNVNGGTSGMTLDHHDDYVFRVAFLPEKKLIAFGTAYGSIHIWAMP